MNFSKFSRTFLDACETFVHAEYIEPSKIFRALSIDWLESAHADCNPAKQIFYTIFFLFLKRMTFLTNLTDFYTIGDKNGKMIHGLCKNLLSLDRDQPRSYLGQQAVVYFLKKLRFTNFQL